MKKLYNQLLNKYADSITILSSTNNKNPLIINDETFMVNLDKIAENYKIDSKKHSTADALLITTENEKNKFYFIEFKKIDFELREDRLMSKFYLENCITKMENCKFKCNLVDDFKKIKKQLIDKYQAYLRSKPYESISLVYTLIEEYNANLSEGEIKEILFNAKKFFIMVSKTKTEYNPYNKNKSNKRGSRKYFSFLMRLVPYHYTNILIVNEKGFNNYFLKRQKNFLYQ